MTVIRLTLLCIVAVILVSGCAHEKAGVRIVLQANPCPGYTWPADASGQRRIMDVAADYARNQLKTLVKNGEPDVTVVGSDKIAIQLPAGISPAVVVSKLAGRKKAARLEFYYMSKLRSIANPLGEWGVEAVDDHYVFTDQQNRTIDSGKQPAEVLSKIVGAPKVKPLLTGADLDQKASANINSRNQIVIQIQFNDAGTKKFADFTRDHVNEYLAIFYNGRLLTCPVIKEPILDGSGEVSGFQSIDEANNAADSLNSGGLPIPLKVVK